MDRKYASSTLEVVLSVSPIGAPLEQSVVFKNCRLAGHRHGAVYGVQAI
jgi:hypothetical protein